MPDNKPKYVLLQGITESNFGLRFFTGNSYPDPTKGKNEETWYKVIGYAETMAEAQTKLYGKSYTTRTD